MFRSVHAAKTASRKLRERAGAIPRYFWAAESRTKWGRSRPTDVLAACMFHVPPSRICCCLKSLDLGVGDVWAENRSENARTCQSSPQWLRGVSRKRFFVSLRCDCLKADLFREAGSTGVSCLVMSLRAIGYGTTIGKEFQNLGPVKRFFLLHFLKIRFRRR